MQHARRAPRVAPVLEREEEGPQRLGVVPAALGAGGEERARERRREAARAGGEARQAEAAGVDDGRPLADPAHDELAVHALEQRVQVGIGTRVLSYHGVLDRHAHALVHQPSHGVESGHQVGAEAVLALEVQDQAGAGGGRDLPHPGLESQCVARVAAGERHHGGEAVAAQERRLVHRSAERGPDARDRPAVEAAQPVEQLAVLRERHVIQEGVAAVEEPRQAAARHVAHEPIVLCEVERAAGPGLAAQRRHGEDAAEVVGRHGRRLHRAGSLRGARSFRGRAEARL